MKRMFTKKGLIVGLTLFSFSLPAVSIQTTRAEEVQAPVEEKSELRQKATVEKKEKAQNRLAETKMRACENREKAISNIMSRIGDRGQKQIELFSSIADKTQAFYAQKGKILSNYDELVADLADKKAAAQTAVDSTKASVVDFSCDGEDPKGAAASFKANMKAQHEALKAYKTAVKNLIVGVKSVQSSTENAAGGEQ